MNGTAILFAAATSGALVLGSVIGLRRAPRLLLAVMLAFAGGGLIAALSYELFDQSFNTGGVVYAGFGMIAGAATFILIDYVLVRHLRGRATGWALLAASVLDGIPENLALGATLATGNGSVALMVAIVAANIPEGLVGAAKMRSASRSHKSVLLNWVLAAILLAAALLLGSAVLESADPRTTAVILAFAAGAVLATLADTVMPEAYKDGGPLVAFATVAGFLLSFVLNSLE